MIDDSIATNSINEELILTTGVTDHVGKTKNGLEALKSEPGDHPLPKLVLKALSYNINYCNECRRLFPG